MRDLRRGYQTKNTMNGMFATVCRMYECGSYGVQDCGLIAWDEELRLGQ